MKLKYVGPKPVISQHGVSFNQSKPDKYIYLHAAVELLETLEGCVMDATCSITDDGAIDLSEWQGIDFSRGELSGLVKKHCKDIDALMEKKEVKTEELLTELKENVHANKRLTADEKRAWLGNIAIMHDYLIQYVENELAFDCMLNVLAEDIYRREIKEIRFDLSRNYGFVMTYLQDFYAMSYKKPLDGRVIIESIDGRVLGRFVAKQSAS